MSRKQSGVNRCMKQKKLDSLDPSGLEGGIKGRRRRPTRVCVPAALSLPFLKSSVDFRFQESRKAVVFHQAVYYSLRPVEAIGARLGQIFTDFFPRHTVDVYLFRKHFHFTHQRLFFVISASFFF